MAGNKNFWTMLYELFFGAQSSTPAPQTQFTSIPTPPSANPTYHNGQRHDHPAAAHTAAQMAAVLARATNLEKNPHNLLNGMTPQEAREKGWFNHPGLRRKPDGIAAPPMDARGYLEVQPGNAAGLFTGGRIHVRARHDARQDTVVRLLPVTGQPGMVDVSIEPPGGGDGYGRKVMPVQELAQQTFDVGGSGIVRFSASAAVTDMLARNSVTLKVENNASSTVALNFFNLGTQHVEFRHAQSTRDMESLQDSGKLMVATVAAVAAERQRDTRRRIEDMERRAEGYPQGVEVRSDRTVPPLQTPVYQLPGGQKFRTTK